MQENTPSATLENVDKSRRGRVWPRISARYWAAIGVIALAVLAQFFQAAPVTTPASVVSATLAPDVTLQIAYPREVQRDVSHQYHYTVDTERRATAT